MVPAMAQEPVTPVLFLEHIDRRRLPGMRQPTEVSLRVIYIAHEGAGCRYTAVGKSDHPGSANKAAVAALPETIPPALKEELLSRLNATRNIRVSR